MQVPVCVHLDRVEETLTTGAAQQEHCGPGPATLAAIGGRLVRQVLIRRGAEPLARYGQEAEQGMAKPHRSNHLSLRATLHVAEQPGRRRSPACHASASARGSGGGSAPPCRSRKRAAKRSSCW